jgi:hypothetical protein
MSTPTPTPTKTSLYKPTTIFSSVQNAIAKGIHEQNFKNGTFRTSITQGTSVIDAFNILLASPELEREEKETVKYCRIQFIHLRNRFPGSKVPGQGEAGDLVEKLDALRRMFERDVERREPENRPVTTKMDEDEGRFILLARWGRLS